MRDFDNDIVHIGNVAILMKILLAQLRIIQSGTKIHTYTVDCTLYTIVSRCM